MKRRSDFITMAVIGHVNSGKSTVAGHLLHKCGGIDSRDIGCNEKESAEMGKRSVKYAWVFDQRKEERERDVTMDINLKKVEMYNRLFTLIDVPGHKDFIANTIAGISQADCALFVVSAADGEYEENMSENGQTREHAVLAFSLGVKEIIVVINKMDTTGYSKARFESIKEEMTAFLRKVGYGPRAIKGFIPISGWNGDNLSEGSANMEWYKDGALMEIVRTLSFGLPQQSKPLRMTVQDVRDVEGPGAGVFGRVETGVIKNGMEVTVAPSNITATVDTVMSLVEDPLDEAYSLDHVGFLAKNVSVEDLKRGDVVGDASNDPPKLAESFIAQVVLLQHPIKISLGDTHMLHCHMAHVPCTFSELKVKLDLRSGKKLEDNPNLLESGDSAIVKLVPQQPICVETFQQYSSLGRFVLRDMKKTLAVGVIKEV